MIESVSPSQKFRALQGQLRERWQSIEAAEPGDADILVLPSLSLEQEELQKVEGVMHYEERLLFSLIRLRHPQTRLIYITSQPLPPIVVDYYLQLLPGIPFSHARDRLLLMPLYDASLKPLSQKLLERPRLLERIRRSMRSHCAYMVCFNSTLWEQKLSLALDIPLLAADPELLYLGTKSGSRQVFADCGVPHPDGSSLVHHADDLVEAAADLWARQPHLQRMVVKLDEGFSGEGNALLNLQGVEDVAHLSHAQRLAMVRERMPQLAFEATTENWEHFCDRISQLGCIVEAFIEGDGKRSPSVQGRVTPTGDVEILSTHDQILGGPSGQIYLGCRFPADAAYRLQIQALGLQVGQYLAAQGVLERYGVDFLAVPYATSTGTHWDIQAIEINLRKGGTTHPFMTLKLLTNGTYDVKSGQFLGQQGQAKYYVATDNLCHRHYQGLLPNDLMDIIAHHRLHFETGSETGTIFHLMGCLSEFGKLGLTSIGNSATEAEQIYRNVIRVLDQETQATPSLASSQGLTSMPPIGWSRAG